jgi:Undecaprenyl-phosphate glucose phosphotransferase
MTGQDRRRAPLRSGAVETLSHRLGREWIQAVFILADILTIAIVAILINRIIDRTSPFDDRLTRSAVLVGVLFITFTMLRGGYRLDVLMSPVRRFSYAYQSWFVAFAGAVGLAFLLKISAEFSRIEIAVFFVVGATFLFLEQTTASLALRGRLLSGVLAVQRGYIVEITPADGGIPEVRPSVGVGTEIVGNRRIAADAVAEASRGVVADIKKRLADNACDLVLIYASWRENVAIAMLSEALADLPLPVVLVADAETRHIVTRRVWRIGSAPGFELHRPPLSRLDRALKRGVDVIVAATALVVLSPLFLVVSLAIVAESGLPVFFRQSRHGFGGQTFRIWKFRSMTVQENGPNVPQARRGDPRVTRVGRFIRRTSIDELPQLLNVLSGEMSLVGPRPHAVAHDQHYDPRIATYAFRQHVKPGITGWAQVNGLRGETRTLADMEARVEHDLWYISNWSLWLDIRILLLTALRIGDDSNAY